MAPPVFCPLAAAPAGPLLLFRFRRRRHYSTISPPPVSSTRPLAPTRRRTSTPVAAAFSAADDDDLFTEDDEYDAPWEGAVVYRRDAAAHHLEYGTTLQRLGLGDLCSAPSRARAAAMGILLLEQQQQQQEEGSQTPVLVSLDVTRRRGGRLRLDGILRTVITLGCFRCAEPAPQAIFANFSLLLTEEPVEEPDVVDLGTIFEEAQEDATGLHDGDGDDQDIDWDDHLHFPAGDKEIDISKHIRDVIHLEITLDALCTPTCKGLCLQCGANLNTGTCDCSREQQEPQKGIKPPGPLKQLLKPMPQS